MNVPVSARGLSWTGFTAASLLLAYQPLMWLWRTWTDPAFASHGYVYVAVIAALVVRSLLSGPAPECRHSTLVAGSLLAAAAALRLVSQVLAINIVGGAALAVDVYALLVLARVAHRPFPLSAFWLSLLFLFSLPVENVLQRVLGFPLQTISADISCRFLRLLFSDVSCEGVRIGIAGQDVLVDLPCSGAVGLMLAGAFFCGLNAVFRPRLGTAVVWGVLTLLAAVVSNSLRITLLAAGLTHRDLIGDLNVMAEPWHSAIGLLTLALALLPLLLWYRPVPTAPVRFGVDFRLPGTAVPHLAMASLAAAIVIVSLPHRPADVSGRVNRLELPGQIGGMPGNRIELTALERHYFEQFGGEAEKMNYGSLTVSTVATRSPLRHLHSPDACLRGLGYDVAFMGTQFRPVPMSLYRAEAPDGSVWLVRVSFLTGDGAVVPSVGEAVWRWLNNPAGNWHSVQRITPWALPADHRHTLDGAVLAALDIAIQTSSPNGES